MAKRQKKKVQDGIVSETKSDRFSRIVRPRVNKAIKSIRLVGNCSGSAYEYTPEQVGSIGEALHAAVEGVIVRFNRSKQSAPTFDFTES